MKANILLAVTALLLVIFLAGCTIEYNTRIQPNQSGTVTTALGFTADEVKYITSQSTSTSQKLCDEIWSESSSKLPPNAVTRQEQKGTETWCYVQVNFANLADLRSFYQDQRATVNRLEVVNNTFYYDVSMDMSSTDMTPTAGFPLTMTWQVSMPGTVQANNADKVSGQSLTWNLSSATSLVDMHAESSLSSSSWIWWVVGGLCCLALIVLVIAAAIGLFFYLRRRKVSPAPAAVQASPAPAPTSPEPEISAPVTPILKRSGRSKKGSG